MSTPVMTAIIAAIVIVAAAVVVRWAVLPHRVSVEKIWQQPVP